MTPKRIYTNKGGTAIITPPTIPLHPTDIEWVPAAEIERLQDAMATARDDALEAAAGIADSVALPMDGKRERAQALYMRSVISACIRAMKGKP